MLRFASSPTSFSRVYANEESTFIKKIDEFKRKTGRRFLSISEIFSVVKATGYTLDHSPHAEMHVDHHGMVVESNQMANEMLGINPVSHLMSDLFDGDGGEIQIAATPPSPCIRLKSFPSITGAIVIMELAGTEELGLDYPHANDIASFGSL